MRIYSLACSLLLCLSVNADAQTISPITCNANAGVPPVIRVEGKAELVGDIIVSCNGGVAGQQHTLNIQLSLNTNITSPVRGGLSDALVLVNEPAAPIQPGINAFRATVSGNVATFSGVQFTAPGANETATLRFTNLWADAASIGVSSTLLPNQVVAFISIPGAILALDNPQQTVAYIQQGHLAEVRTPADGAFTPAVLNAAPGINSALLDGNGTGAVPLYLLKFTEKTAVAFRARTAAPAQNSIGSVYWTESGYFDPQLTPAAEWNNVGQASTGTRFMTRFSGIPAGASLFVSTVPYPVGTPAIATARLVSTAPDGSGAYSPISPAITTQVNGQTIGLAQIPVFNGAATAVWEVTDSSGMSPNQIESLKFAVYLACRPGTVSITTSGYAQTFLAPLADAESTSTPRFSSATLSYFSVFTNAAPLGGPDLRAFLTAPATGSPNTPITGTAYVTNQGSATANAPFTLRIVSGLSIRDCVISTSLPPGANSSTCSWQFTLPAGTHNIRAMADMNNVVAETNENNNFQDATVSLLDCTWTLQRSNVFLQASGGQDGIGVTTQLGCPIRLSPTGVPWLILSSSRPDSVVLSALPNPGPARSVTVIIEGSYVNVTQAGSGCTYAVSTGAPYLSGAGETRRIDVSTGPSCIWFPETNVSWLSVDSQAVRTGPGSFNVMASKNMEAERTGTVSVAEASTLFVQFTGSDASPPEGFLDTPADYAGNITGAIPVTGWALDNTLVSKVEIWRDPVVGESTPHPNGLVFIGQALFVEGARPDVAAQYPSKPFNTRAGWGYLMLTNMLPNANGSPGRGNGTYKLHVWASDDAGNSTKLGVRTITCTNASATRPFGSLDTPALGETISGAAYANFGWALTPQPYTIPVDASTIWVFVDGQPLGHPVYNQFRPDIAGLFPGLANSNGAVGAFILNTTTMTNGLHSIAWSVTDNGGRIEGIGSRLFTVANSSPLTEEPSSFLRKKSARRSSAREGIWLRTGYNPESPLGRIEEAAIKVAQTERIELHLPGEIERGCLLIDNECRDLPVGSTLDRAEGIFYWGIDPAFLGAYTLRFEGTAAPIEVTVAVGRNN
jgi:hypothetical protein